MSPVRNLRLLAGGDVLLGDSSHFLGRGVGSAIRRRGLGHPFSALSGVFAGCDLFCANLESPLTDRPRQGSWEQVYCGAATSAAALDLADRNVVSVANNHILEHGWPVLDDTRAALAGAGIGCAGYGVDGTRGDAVLRWDQGGLPLSFIAASHVQEFWRRRAPAADDEAWLLGALAAEAPRFRIVSLHWGDEYMDRPSPAQRDLARRLIAGGASLVLGHHPHVLQPVERVGDGLVAYSLGNLLFDQDWSPSTRGAGLLDVAISGGRIESWSFQPTLTGREGRVVQAAGPDADRLLAVIHARDFPDQAEYVERLAAGARRHRVLMKAELLRHLPRVRMQTWHFLLTKRRRPRPVIVRPQGAGS